MAKIFNDSVDKKKNRKWKKFKNQKIVKSEMEDFFQYIE